MGDTLDDDGDVQKRKHVGPYLIGRMIGQGAFGKVKLGTNIFTGEKVAVKIISYKNVKTKREKHQIDREREILLRLNHPNIVNLKKVVDDEKRNKCFMIFEYVSGGELFDYIVSHGRLSERDARKFMRQIISAVEYCHSMLVIHRDLKPENLLLDDELNIKISDFGLSNIMEPGRRFSTFCGSLHYACPEILRGEKYLGPGVDIWSMGIILYCLVVGRQPWDGANAEDLIHAILEDGLEVPQGISEECVGLILSMLRVSEDDRIPISKMRHHPWILEGYGEPPPSYLPPSDIIKQLDEEILQHLESMGFVDDPDLVRKELLSNQKTQLVVTYNLLLSQKQQKIAKEEEKRLKRLERQEKKKKKLEKEKKMEISEQHKNGATPPATPPSPATSAAQSITSATVESPSRPRRSASVSTPPTVTATSPRTKKPKKLVITSGSVTPEKLKKTNSSSSKNKTPVPVTSASAGTPSASIGNSSGSNPASPITPTSPTKDARRKSQKKSKTPQSSPVNKLTQANRRPRSTSLSSGPQAPPKFERTSDEFESSSEEGGGSPTKSPLSVSAAATVPALDTHVTVENPKLAEAKKADSRRGRSASVSTHVARPVFSLEDIKSGKVPSPTRASSGPSKKKAVPSRSSSSRRPSILDNDLFKAPANGGEGGASGSSGNPSGQSSPVSVSAGNSAMAAALMPEQTLNQTANTTTLVADTTTTQPVEKIVAEISRVFESQGIKYKKLKDQYIYMCSIQEQGETVRLEVEIVSINKFTNLRGIVVRRSAGDVWAYKTVFEKLVKELKM